MEIHVSTNASQVSAWVRHLFRDQLPSVISGAINATVKEAQAAQRAGMQQRFTIRRAPFVLGAVKVKPFATKHSLSATIAIDPPGGQARADIITRHEEDGRRLPHRGRSLAIPIDARTSKEGVVRRRDRPNALGLRQVAVGRGGVIISKGARRTFSIRRPDGSGVILKRVGPGRTGSLFLGTKVLFALAPSALLDARLGFEGTVADVVNHRFLNHFDRGFLRAMRANR